MFGIGKKSDNKIGDISFLSFYSVVLARLAYFTNINFLSVYLETFGEGKVVPKELTNKLTSAIEAKTDLFDDVAVLGEYLNAPQQHSISFSEPMANFIVAGGKDVEHAGIAKGSESNITINNEIDHGKHIDFYDMAKKINLVNTAAVKYIYQKEDPAKKTFSENPQFSSVGEARIKYFSISNDSYGGTFILADKNIPNAIFVIFRGTYSAKSAGTYTRPDSLVAQPGRAGEGNKYLYGISNVTYSTLHNIMSCCNELVTFLGKQSNPESIQLITTGHSLGGGLATTFSLIFNGRLKGFQEQLPGLKALKSEIYTISVAAPRVLSTETSDAFCDIINGTPQKGQLAKPKIHFRRLAARGDPVPGLPPSGAGFRHPCEKEKDKKGTANYDRHKQGYRHITGALTKDLNINYNENVDSDNVKRRTYLPNPLKHTTYLKIKFTNAVDIAGFATSAIPSFIKGPGAQSETTTIKGESVTRLITGEAKDQDNKAYGMNVIKTADIRMGTDVKEADDQELLGAFQQVKSGMKTLSHDHTELHRVSFADEELHKLSAEASGPTQATPAAGGAKRRRTRRKKTTKRRTKKRNVMKKRRKTMKKRKTTKRRQKK
jgi:hypothetical protein